MTVAGSRLSFRTRSTRRENEVERETVAMKLLMPSCIGRSRINTTTIVARLSDCGQYRPLWIARREVSTAESTEDKGD
jgi:hypothetical protein